MGDGLYNCNHPVCGDGMDTMHGALLEPSFVGPIARADPGGGGPWGPDPPPFFWSGPPLFSIGPH